MAGLHQAVAILGIIVEILRRGARGIAFESGEAVADVGGVADLAGFAVADDVDAALFLLLHGLADRAAHRFLEFRFVDWFAAVLREKQIDDVLRAGQAADVRGQNAVRARFHGFPRWNPGAGPGKPRKHIMARWGGSHGRSSWWFSFRLADLPGLSVVRPAASGSFITSDYTAARIGAMPVAPFSVCAILIDCPFQLYRL